MQIILKSMLTLVLIAEHVQLSVLQEQSPRVRNGEGFTVIYNEKIRKKRRGETQRFFCIPDRVLLVSQKGRAMISGTSFDKGV